MLRTTWREACGKCSGMTPEFPSHLALIPSQVSLAVVLPFQVRHVRPFFRPGVTVARVSARASAAPISSRERFFRASELGVGGPELLSRPFHLFAERHVRAVAGQRRTQLGLIEAQRDAHRIPSGVIAQVSAQTSAKPGARPTHARSHAHESFRDIEQPPRITRR